MIIDLAKEGQFLAMGTIPSIRYGPKHPQPNFPKSSGNDGAHSKLRWRNRGGRNGQVLIKKDSKFHKVRVTVSLLFKVTGMDRWVGRLTGRQRYV